MSEKTPDQQYAVLVPVKPPAVGKSRLAGLGTQARRALAEAFALDTVAACLEAASVARVLVVTDDVRISFAVTALGADAVPDGVSGDLNGTLRQAASEAARRWPGLRPVALCADLPALRAADLDETLAQARSPQPWFVPDAAGVGTTMYAAPGNEFDPRFGPGSRAAHLAAGAQELTDVAPSVRRDVDDLDDLRAAVALGVGPHTVAVLPTR
ncbi:2-phospho-L-lactate guanylyltransferase [Nocardioides sp.]|uniref:2-phospho-L-lactate guanylyltransferase n=1 Tax=Nocardioides sp. TaxID=35761 RepID=UPI0026393B24|nr:2-phospho-L-lactate guanylyltransferase [Nocardioides sp.]MDI6910386.1 2-phospho-L-lactate guanylyltransferase [Nocardioides sp.]